MPASQAVTDGNFGAELSEEDASRSALYRLLGRVLVAPPTHSMLAAMAVLKGDDSPLGRALSDLALTAETSQDLEHEYHDLFIGLARGELVPYGSYYLTGFLYEKPLANLRRDMALLGIARREDVREPEDHVGAVLEMMAGLIDGSFAPPVNDFAAQQRFFATHVEPVAPRFFSDLEKANAARFYRKVAMVGRLFLEVETFAFQLT